jgi:membrane protease subunit (stomatin/prohibitin family)
MSLKIEAVIAYAKSISKTSDVLAVKDTNRNIIVIIVVNKITLIGVSVINIGNENNKTIKEIEGILLLKTGPYKMVIKNTVVSVAYDVSNVALTLDSDNPLFITASTPKMLAKIIYMNGEL